MAFSRAGSSSSRRARPAASPSPSPTFMEDIPGSDDSEARARWASRDEEIDLTRGGPLEDASQPGSFAPAARSFSSQQRPGGSALGSVGSSSSFSFATHPFNRSAPGASAAPIPSPAAASAAPAEPVVQVGRYGGGSSSGIGPRPTFEQQAPQQLPHQRWPGHGPSRQPPARSGPSALQSALNSRSSASSAAAAAPSAAFSARSAPSQPPLAASFSAGRSSPAAPAPSSSDADEEASLRLVRQLQAEEEAAHLLRRGPGGGRGHVLGHASNRSSFELGGGGSVAQAAASWGGQGHSRSGAEAARQSSASFIPPRRAAGGAPRVESDFELAQRLEREELLRLQQQEERREQSSLRRSLAQRQAMFEGNNARESMRGAAGGGSRNRLGTRSGGGGGMRLGGGDDEDNSDDIDEVRSALASAEAERVARRGWGPSQHRQQDVDMFLQEQLEHALGRRGRGRLDPDQHEMMMGHLREALAARMGGFGYAGAGGMGMGMGGRFRQGDALDVDNMDYDALLALGERMGDVKSKGLTKSQIRQLPSSKYIPRKKQPPSSAAAKNASVAAPASASASSSAAATGTGAKRKSDDESSDGPDPDVIVLSAGAEMHFQPGTDATANGRRRNKKRRSHHAPSASGGGGDIGVAAASLSRFAPLSPEDDVVDMTTSASAAPARGVPRSLSNPHVPLYPSLFPAASAAASASQPTPSSFAGDDADSASASFVPPAFPSALSFKPSSASSGQSAAAAGAGAVDEEDMPLPLFQRLFGRSTAAASSPDAALSTPKSTRKGGQGLEASTDSPGAAAAIAAVAAASAAEAMAASSSSSSAAAAAAATPASSPSASPPTEELEEEECCICLTALEEGDLVKRLGCLHVFHAKELDEWLRTSKACPICRVPAM